MSLTMHQRRRLREGRKCLTLPRRGLSTADKHDSAVIVGILMVLAVALWLRLPIVEDALLILLSAVAGVSGTWALWAIARQCRGWTSGEPEGGDTLPRSEG